MKANWLQIRGDPAVRRFLFRQTRTPSLFDRRMDEALDVVEQLLTHHGAFHVKVHFSSTQLSCWFYDEPYNYHVFVGEMIFAENFLTPWPHAVYAKKPLIPANGVRPILEEFKRLRLTDKRIYLRHASINRINGLIGMTFSCDGSHYVKYRQFFEAVKVL